MYKNFVEKIDDIEPKKVKNVFKELLKDYLTPAYGSMSKRDFDILLFMKLQDLGMVSKNPEIYDIVSSLKVTRTKARNLLYESKMRSTTGDKLDSELIELLKKPIFLKDNDKIALEIDNPLLSDHLRAKLKRLGYITDGSFSAELIKLTEDAYIAIFEDMVKENLDAVYKSLIECGAKEDTNFKSIMLSIIKKIGSKFLGRIGEQLADEGLEYLSVLLEGNTSKIKEKYCGFFD